MVKEIALGERQEQDGVIGVWIDYTLAQFVNPDATLDFISGVCDLVQNGDTFHSNLLCLNTRLPWRTALNR
jgi:hypothetical protein